MSDYADFNSNGSVALHIIVILVIAGFFLYAYIKHRRYAEEPPALLRNAWK